jgi:transposase
MPNHKSEDYKLSAVDYYLTEDKSQEEVCKIFKCSTRSLMRWVDKYKQYGEIKRYNRTPVRCKRNLRLTSLTLPFTPLKNMYVLHLFSPFG